MSFAFCGIPYITNTDSGGGGGGCGGIFNLEEVKVDLQSGDEVEINPLEEESVTVVIGVS